MGKVVFWIVVAFAVLLALRLAGLAAAKRRRDPARPGSEPPPAAAMVRCRRCGVYLPRDEARPDGDGFVCADKACAERR